MGFSCRLRTIGLTGWIHNPFRNAINIRLSRVPTGLGREKGKGGIGGLIEISS